MFCRKCVNCLPFVHNHVDCLLVFLCVCCFLYFYGAFIRFVLPLRSFHSFFVLFSLLSALPFTRTQHTNSVTMMSSKYVRITSVTIVHNHFYERQQSNFVFFLFLFRFQMEWCSTCSLFGIRNHQCLWHWDRRSHWVSDVGIGIWFGSYDTDTLSIQLHRRLSHHVRSAPTFAFHYEFIGTGAPACANWLTFEFW